MSAAKKGSRAKAPDFQTTMKSIEQLVAKLEDETTPLEDALETFEKGVLLIRQARAQLTEAEQKVTLLMEKNGEPQARDFMEDKEMEDADEEGMPF